MDPDEILRLKQIGGLADLFADMEFSEAWEVVDGQEIGDDFQPILETENSQGGGR